MSFQARVLVLERRKWDFIEEDSGKEVKGASIRMIDLGQTPNGDGYAVIKSRVPEGSELALNKIPSVCIASFEPQVDKDGRAGLRLVALKLEGSVDLPALLKLPK